MDGYFCKSFVSIRIRTNYILYSFYSPNCLNVHKFSDVAILHNDEIKI